MSLDNFPSRIMLGVPRRRPLPVTMVGYITCLYCRTTYAAEQIHCCAGQAKAVFRDVFEKALADGRLDGVFPERSDD